jgi:ribosomal protein L30/L7E
MMVYRIIDWVNGRRMVNTILSGIRLRKIAHFFYNKRDSSLIGMITL